MLDAKKNKGLLQPYLGNSNVRWGKFDLADLSEMKFEPHEESRYGLLPGDLIVCEGGEPGRCAVWTAPVTNMKIQKALHRIRPKNTLNNYYLYYWFLHAARVGLLEPYFTGTTIKHLTGKAIGALEIPLPPIRTQHAIVDILRPLDARIELANQENCTLEAIASAVFKAWFIDFDPVRAKSEGREPEGMSADIAAQFPSEFVDSELGPIPKGWSVMTLKDQVSAERGLSYKGTGLCEVGEGMPMHNLNSVYEGGGYKYEGIKHYRGEYKERHLVRSGDLIVTNTEQGHNHRLIGFPGMIPDRYAEGLYSHHLYKVVPIPGAVIGRQFVYHLLMSAGVREQVIGCANGSTVNMLKIEGLQIPKFASPPKEIAARFEELSGHLRARIELNREQAGTLASLRDSLLPRLLSGAMTVPT